MHKYVYMYMAQEMCVCVTLFKISLKENFGHPIPVLSLRFSPFRSTSRAELKQTNFRFSIVLCCNIPTVTFGMIYIVRMQM